MEIKVLGTGCARCKSLEQVTRQAIQELAIDATLEKVEDIQKIMESGILRTPGLIINNKIVLTGQVPKIEEVKKLILNNQ
jgi:small redox-active disulfide protein 2